MIHVILRTLFFYVFIIIIFRLMGKREVGQLSIQDLVVSLLIAELVAISIENYKDSILYTVIPVIILLVLELSIGFISLKSSKIRDLIDGKPSLIINKGKINYKEMIKERYTLDDLVLELRNNNIKDLSNVEYAILENNGKLNIFEYENNNEIPFALILDSTIQYDTLKYINKDIDWLEKYLVNSNINLEDIFYAYYKNNKIYIIKKEKRSSKYEWYN